VQPVVFSCPHCQSRLRVRDRFQIGRTIDCPECAAPVQLTMDAAGRLEAIPVQPASQPLTAPAPSWRRKLHSPTAIAWTSVLLAAVVVFLVIFRADEPDSRSDSKPLKEEEAAKVEAPPEAPPLVELPKNELPTAETIPIDVPMAAGPLAQAGPPGNQLAEVGDDPPIDVEMAPDIPLIDVAAQLRQPIVEFTQKEPVGARQLLKMISEMAALPIEMSEADVEAWRSHLDQPVSLSLQDTSVGAILEAVVQQAGLRTTISDGVIHVLPPE
jgi:hypothetical protein